MICVSCRTEVKIEGLVSRNDVCPHCDSDLHSCVNCLNYDVSVNNRCREPLAEWVSDREKANFCDFFIPNKMAAGGTVKPAADLKRSFEDLFKK